MSIIWTGTEDVHFPDNAGIVTTTSYIRTGISRVSITSSVGNVSRSNPFATGSMTDFWFGFWWGYNNNSTFNAPIAGLVSGATRNGIFVGIGAVASRPAILKWDGTTITKLVDSSVDAYPGNSSVMHKIDLHVTNFNSVSGTAEIYVDGVLVGTFTGDLRAGGATSLDRVALGPPFGNSRGLSEFIVANEDTRALSAVTLAPAALGDTHAWTGAVTDVNETVITDANAVFTNTVSQDEEFTLNGLPAGVYTPKAVSVAARATSTAGATATKVACGVKSGGTVSPGTAQTTSAAWTTYEQLYGTNPVTGLPWTVADINALQINLRSS